MTNEKTLYQIALTFINGIGVTLARALMQYVGDEKDIFTGSIKKLEVIPRISKRLIGEIRNKEVLLRAEKELQFITKNNIQPLFFTDDDYPQRLTSCIDAPILLYSKGNTEFNREKIISIVGTRNATKQGQEFCQKFVKDLSSQFSELLVVSGLAYGIDICAHRASLQNNLSTVGVLAHGLDRIYPYAHRHTAIEMLGNGALLTEFPSETTPDKHNFVRRNRIVAGMADAVIVVESGEKGGSLITAEIADSYYREVFAVPGRITDRESIGCNQLISKNKAILLQDTDNFVKHLGWAKTEKPAPPKQRELFLNLNEDEEKIFNALAKADSMGVNLLAIELNTPVSKLFFTLLELEMKNIVQALPGGVYRLL
ncbi:MAG: DNA-processing protein DprA [Dysgonamonadaceae bacterium]|jgi:DNA processing protein|nr:DNA-processing protein DprA [Dysgonamonadaceae bacterium]